jgi:hypothetical protein
VTDDARLCPTCGRPFPSLWKPTRICAACTKPILKGHKFAFGPDSRVRHRNCAEPDSYAAPAASVEASV